MFYRTHLNGSVNPCVASAVLEYQRVFPAPISGAVARLFRSIYRLKPDLPSEYMNSVDHVKLTEEILSTVKSTRVRLQYLLLLEDFFAYAQRRGWTDKKN